MAGAPKYKIYYQGEYIAACKDAEDGAVLAAAHGDGTEIRLSHTVTLWTEGQEDFAAGESYDRVAAVVLARERIVYSAEFRQELEAVRRAAGGKKLSRDLAAAVLRLAVPTATDQPDPSAPA